MSNAPTQESALLRNASDFGRFDEMLGAAKKRAYLMALQLTRNVADAEDLLQETTLKAWKGFDSYIPGHPFLNWLLRIMQRAYLDTKRRDNPIRRADSLNSMISPADGEVQELPIADTGPSPEEELFHLEWTSQLQLALNQLPDVYQSAIRMCDIDELSYSEIAEIQATTVGTVRSRIHRGRKMLREIILRKGIKVPN